MGTLNKLAIATTRPGSQNLAAEKLMILPRRNVVEECHRNYNM
jgi:hypothetical protein